MKQEKIVAIGIETELSGKDLLEIFRHLKISNIKIDWVEISKVEEKTY